MRRLRFWVNLLLLVFPFALLGLLASRTVSRLWVYLNADARFAAVLSEEASRALQRQVTIREVKFLVSPWSLVPNRVRLIGIRIASSSDASSASFAFADELTVRYNPYQLLFGHDTTLPLVSEIQVRRPTVQLQRDAAGHWNVTQLIKPGAVSGRPFTNKISVMDGTLLYDDQAFANPRIVAGRRLVTRFDHLSGVLLIRPDKSIAYQLGGQGVPTLVDGFQSTGIFGMDPLRFSIRLRADRLNAPGIGHYLLAPTLGAVQSGSVDADLSLVYDASSSHPVRTIDLNMIGVNGVVHLAGLAVRSARFPGFVSNLRGDLIVSRDAVAGDASGRFGSADFTVRGSVIGLDRRLEPVRRRGASPSVAVHGVLRGGDFARIIRAIGLPSHLKTLVAKTRSNILGADATGDLSYEIDGPLVSPAATVSGTLQSIHYDHYRASHVLLRAFYSDHIVDADARGEFATGSAVVRGHVGISSDRPFEIEAHGRNLNLKTLSYLSPRLRGGKANLDFAIRGRRGRTPFITAQAEIANLDLNGQQLSSVYARANTLGRTLQVKALRIEDDKGFALGSGTVDLSRQKLDLNVEADELDLGAILAAARKAPVTGTPPRPLFSEPAVAKASTSAGDPDQIQGVGYLRAHIGGTFRHPEAIGRLSAFAVESGTIDVDQATADFDLTADTLKVVSGEVNLYPGELAFAGNVSGLRSGDPRVHFDAHAADFDVNDLTLVAGMSVGEFAAPEFRSVILTGHVSSDAIVIGGTLKAPRLVEPAVLRLQDGSINGLPLQEATAKIASENNGLRLVGAHVAVAGGEATATGVIGSDHSLDLTVNGQGGDIASLLSATPMPDSLLFGGKLGFAASITGSTRDPHVAAQLTGDGLTYNDFAIGTLRVEAGYADKRIQVNHASLISPDGTPAGGDRFDVTGMDYSTETGRIQGSLTWTEVPAERLRRLLARLPVATQPVTTSSPVRLDPVPTFDALQYAHGTLQALQVRLDRVPTPFSGAFSGEAAFSGTVEEPVVDISLNAHNLVIDRQAVTHLISNARLDRHGIVAPAPNHSGQALEVDSPDGTIVVKSGAVGFGAEGDGNANAAVHAEISADQINLGAVQHLPHIMPELAQQDLNGSVNLQLTANGQRTNPTIQASADARNLTYEGHSFDNIHISNLVIQAPTIQSEGIEFSKSYQRMDNTVGLLKGQVKGSIGFQWKSPFIAPNAAVNLSADLPRQDLDALWALSSLAAGTTGSRLSLNTDGHFQTSVRITDTLDQPQVVGTLGVDAGHIKFGDLHTEIRDLHGEIDFDRNSVTIPTGFRVNTYDTAAGVPEKSRAGTPILVSGSLPILDPAKAPGASGIVIRAERVPFDETPFPGLKSGSMRGEGTIDLTVSGSLLSTPASPGMTVRGSLGIQNSQLVPPSDFGVGTRAGFALPLSPALDLTVHIGKNVRVHNSALSARIDGDIVVRGRLFQPNSSTAAVAQPVANGPAPSSPLAVRLFGDLAIREGRLNLPTARFNIVPPSTITLDYPTVDPSQPGQPVLGVNIDVKAQTYLVLSSESSFSGRKRYQVTVAARGPLTGLTEDPATGRSRLMLNVTTSPPDFVGNEQEMQQALVSALGGEAIGQLGRNPGQVVASQLTNMLTSTVLPGLFDRPAAALGFEELAVAYDPIERLSVVISRHLFGPLYFTYIRSLEQTIVYDIKVSLRFHDRYQVSFEQDEQMTRTVLLEGVLRF